MYGITEDNRTTYIQSYLLPWPRLFVFARIKMMSPSSGDSFYNKTQCVDDDGTHASCPDMASTHDIIKHFTSYDFRIDVRSEEEWTQGIHDNPH